MSTVAPVKSKSKVYLPIDRTQVEKAVKSLFAYAANKKKTTGKEELFGNEFVVSLVVTLKRIPEKGSNMPLAVKIPHSLYNHPGVDICLISKDPQAEYQEKLSNTNVARLREIIGVTKLRKNYAQYEDKRELCSQYQLFLADSRIIPMLPALLGKTFFDKKKQPVAVKINSTDEKFAEEISKARDSTYMFLSTGPTIAIKIGNHHLNLEQIVDNICESIPSIVSNIPRKSANVQSISVKTTDSIALPIFHAVVASETAMEEEVKSSKAVENKSKVRVKSSLKEAAEINKKSDDAKPKSKIAAVKKASKAKK